MTAMSSVDLLGREDEVARIAAVLEDRHPALIAVTGDRGSGKSYITNLAVRAAISAGWRATPYVNGRGVRVGRGTTAAMVVHEVSQSLGLPDGDSGTNGHASAFVELADRLAHAAERDPVLVVLDPYQPSPELARKISGELVPAVRNSRCPVVIMVVARRDLRSELHPDLEVTVSQPDVDAIERTLRATGDALEPPLDDAELALYVTAARDNPRLLTSLAAVLPLSRPGAGHKIPAPARHARRN